MLRLRAPGGWSLLRRPSLGEHAQPENQHPDRGEFQFLAHAMLLGQSDVERKANIGASQSFKNFSKEEHWGG